MAESDDDFDRRNVREKFRPERNDYERRGDDRRVREPWDDSWANRARDRRDGFDRGRRDRSPPPRDASPPQMKRARRDWEDGGFPHYEVPYGGLPPPPVASGPPPPGWTPGGDAPAPPVRGTASSETNDCPTQPAMLTFKQFLNSQDDNITDEEAIKKFSEYKMDFRKQQIHEFFVQHKDEGWFKMKYHPEEYEKRQEEARCALLKRCEVFSKLIHLNRISSVTVDIDNTDNIIKLLDSAVILLENGSEFDLKVLDQSQDLSVEHASKDRGEKFAEDKKRDCGVSLDSTTDDANNLPLKLTEPPKTDLEASPVKSEHTTKKVKKPRDKSAGSGSESETGSLSDTDEEADKNDVVDGDDQHTNSKDFLSEKECSKDVKDDDTQDGMEEGEERDEPRPRALHRTQSIFLRSLPHLVTVQEVEEVCKRYPGFLRVVLEDPRPERKFLRRGWITFDHSVNIKEICWNLNNIRLRDGDIGAIVNRELKQRVRAVSGLTNHRTVAKQDVKHAAKIIQVLDSRWNLWLDNAEEKKDKEKENFGFISHNPVLKGIAEHLVDEGSYEEEALLGQNIEDDKLKETSQELIVDKDVAVMRVLDKLILYLRIVHSFDYYSAIEYPNEDEMPHRCGIIHARGQTPAAQVMQSEIMEWIASFEQRILPFINTKIFLDDTEMVRLGKKNPNDEVEKFIQANTQELGKDKWLCPLSGKKFKGPDFVRKHIIAKHMEKVDEVKQEVMYFNNYLKDPRRPQLPEHPSSKPSSSSSQTQPAREGYVPQGGAFHGPLPPPPHLGYRPVLYQGRRAGGPQFQTRGGPDHFRGDFRRDRFPPRREGRTTASASSSTNNSRADPRGVVNYHDLDAPADVE